jgi:hypothetical protein
MPRIAALLSVPLVALAVAPASASADANGGASFVEPTAGGAQYGAPAQRVDARPVPVLLEVAPTSLRAGRMPDVRFRIVQRGMQSVDVRVAVVPLGGREAAVNVRLGEQATDTIHTVPWPRKAALGPGRYTVRLHATDRAGHTLARRAHQSGKAIITVTRAPKPKPHPQPDPTPSVPVDPAGAFPVMGPHGYGGEDADFGSPREGHVHQGQDVTAAEGTPIVAPTAGTVIAVDFQKGGAGEYVVLSSVDGRDFFFAHLVKGSTAVVINQSVVAGTPLGRVGSTGSSSGPHLHVEIWEGGWQRGRPVDPLAQLKAWDR